ncbi:MAG: type II toxin-antitoxin system VapC family toxin [Gemmatimonadota bacterium]
MVLDSSAVVAMLLSEPAADRLAAEVEAASDRRISAATLAECGIVLQVRRGDTGAYQLDQFIARANVRVEPVTRTQSDLARDAFRRFGKGRHPAALNFGDCFTYALAADLGESILHTGDDFSRTDIASIRC